ncbi:MAG TPA: hypothetical protein VGA45_06270, partial [Actinomycetota bacterium]
KMSAAMASMAFPTAAQELAALVLEAAGRGSRESFLAIPPPGTDREGTGWFEAVRTPIGPQVSKRVDRRSKRLEAYPPIEQRHQADVDADLGPPPARPAPAPERAERREPTPPDDAPGGAR